MQTIRILPPEVVSKIAAGEVVERPASVVKELVENAVDAQASRIEVVVAGGGRDLIRVTDDGVGIAAEELELAVASHATSKISSADDLFRIKTLGFRGEALASIASVSRMIIRSCRYGASEGAELEVVAGKIQRLTPCGCPPGTAVEVRDLFFNTPVRRRFLRGVQTELGHITEAFVRVALAWPQRQLRLIHNDRPVLDLPAVESHLERVGAIFGRPVADKLIAVESRDGEISISGFVGHPSESRPNNRWQYLFCNGRFIRDRTLQHALAEAYRGLLTVGRYPVAFLWMEVPPDWVDVNVHPTKLEVRFVDSGRLYGQLLAAIRSKFLATDLTVVASWPKSEEGIESPSESGLPAAPTEVEIRHRVVEWARGKLAHWQAQPASTGKEISRVRAALPNTESLAHRDLMAADRPESAAADRPESAAADRPESAGATGMAIPQPGASVAAEGIAPGNAGLSAEKTSAGGIRPQVSQEERAFGAPKAMQVLNRYLVTEAENGVLLIDQHALHERVLYSQIMEQLAYGPLPTQGLMIPEPIDLRPEEAAILLEHRAALNQLGFGVEPFGGSTVLVTGYPAIFQKGHLQGLIRGLAERLQQWGRMPESRELLAQLASTLACRAAVKAGDPLTAEEIAELLSQRHLVSDAHHCPHGRPAALLLSREELDRQFKRL